VSDKSQGSSHKCTPENTHDFRDGLLIFLSPFLIAVILIFLKGYLKVPPWLISAAGGNAGIADLLVDTLFILLAGISAAFLFSKLILRARRTSQALGQSTDSVSEEINRRVKLFDQTPVGIIIIDPKTARFLEFNKIAHQQLGYTREEFSRLGIPDVEAGESSAETNERIASVLRDGRAEFETRQRTKQGQIRDVHVIAQAINVGGAGVYQCIWQDITERKLITKMLRDERDHARRLLDIAGVMILTLDCSGTVTLANRKACEILGCKIDDILGKNWLNSFVPERSRPGVQVSLDQLFSGNLRPAEYAENPVVTCAGQERMVAWRNTVIRDDAGNVTGVLSSGEDITDRLKSETEKQNLRQKAELAGRLASVGEMAAGFAHEINNPLTGVIGFAEMLKERDDLPADVLKDVNIISDGAKRVADIVKRILTFARQTKPVRIPSDLNSLIESTLSLQTYVLKTGNIEVIREFDRTLPLVTVDEGQMQQVFVNLIVNAEHAMPDGGKLTVSTARMHGSIRIVFKDTGYGIPNEIMGKIFDPFYTTKPKGLGTGLGLSLSHSIIAEHGGDIFAESEPGHGASFIIDLPLPADCVVKTSGAVPQMARTSGGQSSILVVDDEQPVRTLLKNVLESSGIFVDAAATPEEALQKIGRKVYDLLVLDIRLPGMNGADLYQRILEISPLHTGRVIFITGYVGEDRVRGELESMGAPLLLKPFEMDKFLNQIESLLASSRPK
jgi:PAS domain S-box-containing protein